jgi:hypothetical protein
VNKYAHLSAIIVITISLLVANSVPVGAQDGSTSHYFADTGHNVSGDFWIYYQGVPNASQVFGSPITEAITDAHSGRLIQYFQRARFELYPENSAGQRVQLSLLGAAVYQRTTGGTKLNFFPTIGCRNYSDIYICYDFLTFFDKNGGEAVFGKPVSRFEFYNGRIVQYFERARFEWYPEYPEGQKVVLAEVGRIYFDLVPEDPNLLQAVQAGNDISGNAIQRVNTKAFTWKAVTQIDDQQAVYVVVQDQTLRPVSGATTVVTVFWPAGGSQKFLQTTNQYGVAIVPFQVHGQPYGSVVNIQVDVLYQGIPSRTVTSFRIWQ